MFRFVSMLMALFLGFLGQAQITDSIMGVEELNAVLEKSLSLRKTKMDSAELLLEQIKPHILKQKDPNLFAEHALQTSWLLLRKDNYEDILELLTPNLENKDEIDLSLLGRTYQHIGHVYKLKWVPDSALVNYIKALKTAQKAEDQRTISLTYLALGLTYTKLGDTLMASDFYDKSMKYSTNTELVEKHKELITGQDNRPVSVEKVIELGLDIVKIAQRQNNDLLLATAYSDLRKEYFRVKNFPKALEYAEKELVIREKIDFSSTTSNTWTSIANIYAHQNRFQKALELYQKALPKASDTLRLEIHQGMKSVYAKQGNAEKALNALEDYTRLKDSIDVREREKSIATVMAQFETELQAEQIKTLSAENALNASKITQQRTTLFAVLGGSLLLLAIGFFGYRSYRTKQELNYTQLNFKLLQTQMNPHFMFNALNEINLNLDSQTKEVASQNLLSYSALMRNILQSSTREFVSVKEDVNLISKFLETQQLMHETTFMYDVEVAEEIDVRFMVIPPMLTQPFVENAVLHGIKGMDGGNISVHYALNGEVLCVTIQDNGKGFSSLSGHSGNELHTSMGTSIIDQRIATYQKLHRFTIKKNIKSSSGKGTLVTLEFPVKYKKA
ncbi:tetratricopeptide repeat protein [Aureisphaera galaxeae]|uniref:tetratricopeptide repeat-containing sensor histidine kinase n=1 Tax=Aureisphaera galaxeae TaxID=1538023 RepID=UPI002350CD56|nr:tetratricopeptide repeat protein [Aureisphaera galaxeae]MDC8003332.1 tetratricopeptide repeat protein [Aureisphaera galaxeae]